MAFRVAALAMTLATAGIVLEFVRTRRLADVAGPMRLPDGANAPLPLAFPHLKRKETTMTDYIDVDVRPILRSGGEPFSVIMAALDQLAPGQGLRLYATFKPVPLFAVMADKGFAHSERALDGGEWEVLFEPVTAPAAVAPAGPFVRRMARAQAKLDNRDLEPPEPMVRILAAAEKLAPGETLSALLRREPVFLFPQLEKRGFRWLGGFSPDGATYELTVRAPA